MLPKGSIARVGEYYFSTEEYADDIMRALREFFDRPDLDRGGKLDMGDEKGEGFFNEWFLYDFKMANGKTALENFVARNPLRLSDGGDGTGGGEMALYRSLLDNKFGVFEVVSIERDKGLELRDLQTDMAWQVREKALTRQAKPGDVFFARIANVGDHYELVGANTFSMALDEAGKRQFRETKGSITPKQANEIWSSQFEEPEDDDEDDTVHAPESKKEILARRKELEQEIKDMLKETESDFALEDVLGAIYNEEETDDMMKVVAMFDRGGDATELENVLELVTDAWNYFPHKALGGKSPEEE